MMDVAAVSGARIFDGSQWIEGHDLMVAGGMVTGLGAAGQSSHGVGRIDADGLLVVPGFIDLQVNGGGGVLLNNQPDLEGIETICAAHARFGSTALLPTLITDRSDVLVSALAAGKAAWEQRVPGYLGLHLEGPHLSVGRKGTHDPELIRPMTDLDLTRLRDAAGSFGFSLMTVAPENVTPAQVEALCEAGYRVSLGHTDAGYTTALSYAESGATLVTHLFNAMSQLGNREPGVVGAALALPGLHCGLIADGFHVDPVSMGIALRAKSGPGRIFLVTDAMSTIGTDDTGFMLNGREVYRQGGRLTLADGTLAGADIDMLSCVRYVHEVIGLPLEEALRMASTYPAAAIGASAKGHLAAGADADFLLLTPDLDLVSTWIGGRCVYRA
ncbi:N-acetylglucosamine-6-phosphate deacetylase [Rhizobium sp. RU36D]|uniref:N-acetylglucosamine-6-phosphate deacetylase n=1 Tax=Rhizobium sp. RU36D TaxID=1907415 RepID=UPI0009D7C2D4|nr:N-acetylglucosamine-6-phosphate deacetylase [Rhizobium sp. RU36D]SMC46613.1 N-acetylglucosamine 6-phosphate deacetylase [Rhizobium sp. RU36D]